MRRRWPGYAAQKNWALANLDITSDWVLVLDADERLSLSAVAAVRRAVESTDIAAYELPRRYIFLGRELRHAWWYPDYQVRLFRRGRRAIRGPPRARAHDRRRTDARELPSDADYA